jgi:hypothetical protein
MEKETLAKEFGVLIRRLRLERGYSQEGLGSGSPWWICSWSSSGTGAIPPTDDAAESLASAFPYAP